MEYIVGKSFLRADVHYRAGAAPPPDLDKVSLQHYLRHGMLTEAAPAEPATPIEPTEPTRTPAPKTARQAAPQEAQAPARAPEGN